MSDPTLRKDRRAEHTVRYYTGAQQPAAAVAATSRNSRCTSGGSNQQEQPLHQRWQHNF